MNRYKFHHTITAEAKDYLEFHLREAEIMAWCRQQFGPEYNSRWAYFIDGFNFNDEKDFELFLLKWA